MADWLKDLNTIIRGTFAPTPKGPYEDMSQVPTAPPMTMTQPATDFRNAMEARERTLPTLPGFLRSAVDTWNRSGDEFRAQNPEPGVAAPFQAAAQYSRPREGSLDQLPAGMMAAKPGPVTNPNPSGRGGQIPIGALLELAKVMPKPKQQSFGEQLVGMQFARLQQQLAAAKDPKVIEEIGKRMDALAIAGNRGNPMNYSLSALLGQGND